MNNLHPIFQQALAPFVRPAPTFKGACGNRNVSPMIVARVFQHGRNDYRVVLTADGMDSIEYGRHEQYGQAFAEAHWFSKLAAEDVAYEIARASRVHQ
jgi:hypothetical protein